jgi:hypothetical protein
MERLEVNTIPTYQDLLRSQEILVEQNRLGVEAARTRKSRTGKLISVLGEEAVGTAIAQLYNGTFDEEDFSRRYRNGAFKEDIPIGQGEPQDPIGRLRNMIEAHEAYVSGDTKVLSKPRRALVPSEKTLVRTEEHSREHSIVSVHSPETAVAEQPSRLSARDIETRLKEDIITWLAVIDTMPFDMDEKMAFHRMIERVNDSVSGRRTYGLVKFGVRNIDEEM